MADAEALARFLRAVPSIEDEVAPYRGLEAEEKLALVKSACATGAKLLGLNPDAARIRAYRDPWPESTVRLMRGGREKR